MNYTYILQCADGTYYTGWTNNLEKRVEDHNQNRGAKYTRGRTPVKLVYSETFETKSEALKKRGCDQTTQPQRKRGIDRETA